MGRRLCVNDNNHPNNVYIEAIKPKGDKCRVCGGELKTRSDDQDEDAIDKRHNIYYDTKTGTMAAVNFFKKLSAKGGGTPRIIELDGRPGVKEVSADLLNQLKQFV
jgi:adenylate kinase